MGKFFGIYENLYEIGKEWNSPFLGEKRNP